MLSWMLSFPTVNVQTWRINKTFKFNGQLLSIFNWREFVISIFVLAKEKVVEIPMKHSAVTITTSKHVVTQEMVPTFVVPLKRETRVPEHSVAMYVVSDLVKLLKNKLYFKMCTGRFYCANCSNRQNFVRGFIILSWKLLLWEATLRWHSSFSKIAIYTCFSRPFVLIAIFVYIIENQLTI